MASVGTLAMNLTANSAGFTRGVNEAARSLNAFQSQVSTIGGSIGGRLAGLIGVGGGAGFLGWGVKLAADAETAQASFSILAGSAEGARRVLADIKAISQQSPLSQAGLRDAASVMMQFGVEASTVTARLRNLGDLSMGNEQRLGSLALAFGQMTAAGRLMGQDLLQMINAGFNPLQEISRKTGESIAELKARMEAGGVSAKEVSDAFDSATAAGGRFHGMLDARAGTTAGGFAKMQASAAALAQSIGEALLPAANDLIAAVTPMVRGFNQLDTTTRSNIVHVVALGGALAASIVVIKGVYSVVMAAVAAYEALAAAEIVAKAFSGPAGWAALAAGAVVAGAALGTAAHFMRNVGRDSQEAAPKIEASATAMRNASDAAKTLVQFTDKLPASLDINFGAKLTEDATKQLDDLLKRGQEVTKQFRTPGQEFADTTGELQQLFALGAINVETYQRGIAAARKDLADSVSDQQRIEDMKRGVGAAVVGTREGFSAVQEGLRNADAQRAKEQAIARAMPQGVPGVEKNVEATRDVATKIQELIDVTERNASIRNEVPLLVADIF